MTRRLPNSISLLLILTLITPLLADASKLYAQDCADALREAESVLREAEQIANDAIDQRNTCLVLVNKTRSERDRCLGSSDELIRINQALNVKLADYERIVANNESLKRKRWHFYVAGVATPVVLAGLSILIYMAAF